MGHFVFKIVQIANFYEFTNLERQDFTFENSQKFVICTTVRSTEIQKGTPTKYLQNASKSRII